MDTGKQFAASDPTPNKKKMLPVQAPRVHRT